MLISPLRSCATAGPIVLGSNATVRLDALWLAHFGSLGKTKVTGKVASACQGRRSETSLGGGSGLSVKWGGHFGYCQRKTRADTTVALTRMPLSTATSRRMLVHGSPNHSPRISRTT